MNEVEEWTEIEEFPHYLISTHGNVKHVNRKETRTITVNERGFPVILLSSATSPSRYLRQINNLVANAFLRPSIFDDENYVWHKDGNLLNCHAENLKWATKKEVLEWNDMHRRGRGRYPSATRVRNNRSGITYTNAYECAMAEGELESKIIWRIERQARHMEDDNAHYRYLFNENDL